MNEPANVSKKTTEISSIKLNSTFIDDIVICDSEDITKDQKQFGFYVWDGIYKTIEKNNKGSETEIQLSNFVMKSVFHLLNGSNNTNRIIFIQRSSGQKYFVDVLSSEMKPESFETILKSKRCTFFGNAYQLKRIFAKMMDEETEAITLDYLGWNQEHRLYAFANAIFSEPDIILVDKIGIVTVKQTNYYLPAFGFTNINSDDFRTERLYKYEPGQTNFEEWSRLFYEAFGSNAIIGLLFTISAIYRDIIFNSVGFFPFLFLFGDFGTGKTSFTENLLSLFGRDTVGTPLNNATIVALSRLVSSRCNSLFYFKEYTNETDSNAEDFILTAYDGAGRTTGIKSNDNKTKSYPVRSGLIFDGNHLPSQKSAILSRMVLLNFEISSFSTEQTNAFKKLKELEFDGLGIVLTEILSCRNIIEDKFASLYRQVSREIKNSTPKYPERILNHISLLYTIYKLLQEILKFPINDEIAKKTILDNAESINNLLAESSSVSVFWQSFAYCVKKGLITRYDETSQFGNRIGAIYRIKIEPAEDVVILQIKLPDYFPNYVKYCKENNIRFLDNSSLRMMLTSKSNKTFIPSTQKGRKLAYTDKQIGSCYQFYAEKTETGISINDVEINI